MSNFDKFNQIIEAIWRSGISYETIDTLANKGEVIINGVKIKAEIKEDGVKMGDDDSIGGKKIKYKKGKIIIK